jgi:hypothetical protein
LTSLASTFLFALLEFLDRLKHCNYLLLGPRCRFENGNSQMRFATVATNWLRYYISK